MEKFRRRDAMSQSSKPRSTKLLRNLSENASASRSVNEDPKTSSNLPTESERNTTPTKSRKEEITSHSIDSADPLLKNCHQNSDLQKLKNEMEMLQSQARLKKKENEILRWLLTSEKAKPERTFHRAIFMRVYPEEVINAIGAHEGHHPVFVALEATLFTSKSLPIQKISTSFSDGHWQEEMRFVLDTESRWMEGRFVLELKTKNNASDDEIIATGSISPHRFLDWLHEGGEHSVQINMNRTCETLDDELGLTMLLFTVEVATEKMLSDRILNIEDPLKSVIAQQIDDESSQAAIKNLNQNSHVFDNEVTARPGTPDVAVWMPYTDPCLSNYVQPVILESAIANKDSITFAASSTDDEEPNTTDASNTISTKAIGRFKSAPTSNRSCSSDLADSAAHLSMLSVVYQRKHGGSKNNLKPAEEVSTKDTQMKLLSSSLLDPKLVLNHATLQTTMVSKTTSELGLLEIKSEKHGQESKNQTTDNVPKFESSIQGVSLGNQNFVIKSNGASKADIASESSVASKNSHSSTLVEAFPSTSRNPDQVSTLPINQNIAIRCWYKLRSSLKLWFATAQIILSRVFGQFHKKKSLAAIQPIREILDEADSEIEALRLSEQRKHAILASQLKAKLFLEDFSADADQDQGVNDAVEKKFIFALSRLQNAFFKLPYRAVKITSMSQIENFMMTLPVGKSSSHQRLAAIQQFLQSKWIYSDSMLQIMKWIKNYAQEVKFFECMAMRVVNKQGLTMIARRFIHAQGTQFTALKTVERLLVVSNKDSHVRQQRRGSHFRVDDIGEQDVFFDSPDQEFSVDESNNL